MTNATQQKIAEIKIMVGGDVGDFESTVGMSFPELIPALTSLVKEELESLLEQENVTYGGMGSDEPCVPVSAMQEHIERLEKQ